MTKLDKKWLKDYSFGTLRDVDISGLADTFIAKYDLATLKWKVVSSLFKNLFAAEYFDSEGNSNTTSTGWVTKLNVTTEEKKAGEYIIMCFAEVTNDMKNRDTGMQIQWRETGGSWEAIHDTRAGTSTDDLRETRGTFKKVTLPTDNSINIRVRYGQADSGGTVKIRDVRLLIFRWA